MVDLHRSPFFHIVVNYRLHQWNIILGRHTYHSQLARFPNIKELHIPGSGTSIIPAEVSKVTLFQYYMDLTWHVDDSEMVLLRASDFNSQDILTEGWRRVIWVGSRTKSHRCSSLYV